MKKRTVIQSFGYAFNGLFHVIATQRHMRVHCIAGSIAVILSFVLHISKQEFIFIIMSIGAVWAAEMFNTAIEEAIDYMTNGEIHPTIKIIKDMGAGAVLVLSMTALAVGLVIFIPKIF